VEHTVERQQWREGEMEGDKSEGRKDRGGRYAATSEMRNVPGIEMENWGGGGETKLGTQLGRQTDTDR
jgi:hypothetical protein